MDFERFTNQTKEAIAHSQQILQRYKHSQLDTEHILLALLEQEDGVVPRVLGMAGADVTRVRKALERELGKRPQGPTIFGEAEGRDCRGATIAGITERLARGPGRSPLRSRC